MADILLLRHDFDGKHLMLAGRLVGGASGRRIRAALVPAKADAKPHVEKIVAVGADGVFRIELPVGAVAFGTRLELVDADDDKTFWIGSGANVPPGWFAGATPVELPGSPTIPGGPTIPGIPGVPTGPGPDPGPGPGPTPGGPVRWPFPPFNFGIPCLCALLPFSCTTLLGAWKALLILAIGLWYVCLVLVPPDWGVRTAWCIITDEGLKAVRLGRVTATSGVGGASGGATTSGVAGAVGGGAAGTAVAPGPGTAAGGAGGGAVGAGVGGVGGGGGAATTAATGEIVDQQIGRTIRGIIGLIDGMVALAGMFLRILAELVSLVAFAIMVVWFICCARGDKCRLIANLAWVLEALIVVAMPIGGAIVGLLLWMFTFLPHVACARAGTQWFIDLAGGVLIATVCYGLVRWLRDRGRCPVLVLWQWPWTEKTP